MHSPGQPARPSPRPCAPRLRPACRAPAAACSTRPSAQLPTAPARAPARTSACALRPRPARLAPVQRPPALPARALRAQLPSLCCIVTRAYPGSQYSLYCNTNLLPTKLYCNTISSQANLLYCNTIAPLAIQFPFSSNLLHCNTNQCIAIHFQPILGSSLQYKILYCNTIPFLLKYNWAVAYSKSAPFFFRFSL